MLGSSIPLREPTRRADKNRATRLRTETPSFFIVTKSSGSPHNCLTPITRRLHREPKLNADIPKQLLSVLWILNIQAGSGPQSATRDVGNAATPKISFEIGHYPRARPATLCEQRHARKQEVHHKCAEVPTSSTSRNHASKGAATLKSMASTAASLLRAPQVC